MIDAMKVIGYIYTDFDDKFGIPRQSGLVDSLEAKIVFEPEYSDIEAFRGLEEYSHMWIVWKFSRAVRDKWSPTVRPPRLGGNKRMGVFGTRSPFRPNPVGLSSVRLQHIDMVDGRVVVSVSGADMLSGTPIYDIKPYLPYTDSHPDAVGGFADRFVDYELKVEVSSEIEQSIPADKIDGLRGVLAHDPRPSYQNDSDRIYGMKFGGMDVKFRVEDGILYVVDIYKK